MLRAILAAATPHDAIVATTGYTGRELFALDDRSANFYMVGSMGCASSIGLGIALTRPDRRIIVLDGDGALLMRLGAMTTTGRCRPSNLIHILLDNASHESTGGQATASPGVDFCAIAAACGYAGVHSISAPSAMTQTTRVRPVRTDFHPRRDQTGHSGGSATPGPRTGCGCGAIQTLPG